MSRVSYSNVEFCHRVDGDPGQVYQLPIISGPPAIYDGYPGTRETRLTVRSSGSDTARSTFSLNGSGTASASNAVLNRAIMSKSPGRHAHPTALPLAP